MSRLRLATLLAGVLALGGCGSSAGSPMPNPGGSHPPATPSLLSPAASPSPSAIPAPLATSPYSSPAGPIALPSPPARTAFVQLFEWRWADVAIECEQWLGPRGFAGVQVSPPQEHALIDDDTNHFPWWQRYQAVSYQIQSRSGTRVEFEEMTRRCAAVGVDIYVDTLLNHTTAGDGVGSAGSAYTKYSYPGIYVPTDFHAHPDDDHAGIACDRSISNFGDPVEVQTCELLGLADLRTEDEQVQERLASYMADLYALGARGYRLDAAKHINDDELAAILERLRAKLPADADFFIVQEVIDEAAIWKSDYYDSGRVDEFAYSRGITAAFLNRNGQTIGDLQRPDAIPFLAPSDAAVPFVDNHDSQRGRIGQGQFLTYKRAAPYSLANVFMLAYPYGFPRLMSSYVFSDTEVGPPSDAAGATLSVFADGPGAPPNCGLTAGQWVCEHRWQAIAGMVGFRNVTHDSPEITHWWTNPDDGNQIAFGRGAAGFVVINRSEAALAQTLPTSLPAGTYCDVTSGERFADGSACTGRTVEVAADGLITVDLPPLQALAIHIGAMLP